MILRYLIGKNELEFDEEDDGFCLYVNSRMNPVTIGAILKIDLSLISKFGKITRWIIFKDVETIESFIVTLKLLNN